LAVQLAGGGAMWASRRMGAAVARERHGSSVGASAPALALSQVII